MHIFELNIPHFTKSLHALQDSLGRFTMPTQSSLSPKCVRKINFLDFYIEKNLSTSSAMTLSLTSFYVMLFHSSFSKTHKNFYKV